MTAIADMWTGLSPDSQAIAQGVLLMLLLQGYKWLQVKFPGLPDLKSAEPRLKQFVVAVCAFLFALAALPVGGTNADLIQLWIEHMVGAVTSHQLLSAYINKPLEIARTKANG